MQKHMPKAGSQSHAVEKNQMGWMPRMPRGHNSFCSRYSPSHGIDPQHSDLQEHRQCPQPDEKHEITENHWKSLKLKNLISPPVHTKNKTTERSLTFANFFQRQSENILTIFTVQSTTSFITAQWNKNPPTFH